ncbi:hypothetical protein FACS189418_6930 [Clostridia bacterium]|nr:hypothetical protein FACS189418_6930 [Clostridia bacterium]
MQAEDGSFHVHLGVYHAMAYYLSQHLHIDTDEILTSWSVAKLIVSYGYHINIQTSKNFQEWKSLELSSRKTIPRPKEYGVYFYSLEEWDEVMGNSC